MSISVLTLVRNRAEHLDQLVEGLRRSSVPPLELVVVDMASELPVAVEDTAFPARIIRLKGDDLPLAAARNRACEAAHGERLLFLDVDCIPMRDLIGDMDSALRGHDALICAEILYLGPGDARTGWTEEHLRSRGRTHPVRNFPRDGLRCEANAGLFWSLAFGIRRQRFQALGGFCEAFTGYGGEDTDFGFRAADAGLPLLFMGGAGAFHQYHDSLEPPLLHVDHIVRNAMLFRRRWGHLPMTGWLSAFEAMGLVSRSGDDLVVARQATPEEVERARVDWVAQ